MEELGQERPWGKADGGLLAQQESSFARLALLTGLGIALVAVGYSALVTLTQASRPWHYLAAAAFMGLMLLLGVSAAAFLRRAQAAIFAQLRTTLSTQFTELQDMAARDELTQLFNRRCFYQRLQEGLEQARAAKEPLALILIDVDDLKGINDNYGHQIGDLALRNLAQLMRRQVRAGDVVARLGGDEFGIVMPNTDKRGAFALARRIWQDLAEHPIYQKDGDNLHLDVSIGVSGYPWGGDDVDQMMHWADADMYAHKVSRKLSPTLMEEEPPADIEAVPSDYA